MPIVIGTVQKILVTEDTASVKIQEDDGSTSTMLLWTDYAEDSTPTQRIAHGQWLAVLRDAFVGNFTVSVSTVTWTNQVESVSQLR